MSTLGGRARSPANTRRGPWTRWTTCSRRGSTASSWPRPPTPPPPGYIPVSGGIFRDGAVHDIDGVRFVTGREVVQVVAVGANKGEDYFAESDDVDTGAALLPLDDGTIAIICETRYNAAGY